MSSDLLPYPMEYGCPALLPDYAQEFAAKPVNDEITDFAASRTELNGHR
jgi:hypothetical protein